jgi:hypothetical protein
MKEAHVTELPKTGPELVRYYNERADAIGAPHVKRFSTTASGVARCTKIDEEVRRKKDGSDIVSSATEPVSAVSEEEAKSETTLEEDANMSTQVAVSFEKQVVRKTTPSKAIPKTLWQGSGPRFSPKSKLSQLTEALLKKAMTVKEMGKLAGRLNTVRLAVTGGYIKATLKAEKNSKGDMTYRLLKK